MTPRDFCYFLRGHLELVGEGPLTAEQVKVISDHLKLVMVEVEKPTSWSGWQDLDWNKEYCAMMEDIEPLAKELPAFAKFLKHVELCGACEAGTCILPHAENKKKTTISC